MIGRIERQPKIGSDRNEIANAAYPHRLAAQSSDEVNVGVNACTQEDLAADPAKRIEEEENYRVELQRLAERPESEVERIRRG